jgi:hypothetical protein
MSWKLWLDDQHDEPEMVFRHPPKDFIAARSSAEAIQLTQEKGLPNFISFDHDLGGPDDAMKYISWISHALYDSTVPDYQVHSANPVGRDNIVSKMESWKKSQLL